MDHGDAGDDGGIDEAVEEMSRNSDGISNADETDKDDGDIDDDNVDGVDDDVTISFNGLKPGLSTV